MRLICLPYAGAGVAAYHPWLAQMPAWLEIAMVRLPGRETRLREQPCARMECVVAALLTNLRPLTDRPYAFFGHSMGGLIAFELARALQADGALAPKMLFISGRRAPQLDNPEPPMHTLADGPFVGALMRRYNAIPRVLLEDVDLLRVFLPALRADVELLETYSYAPGVPLQCPLLALGGRDDEHATLAELQAWESHTCAAFGVRQFVGGHFYFQSDRAALPELLVSALEATLETSMQ